MDQPEEVTDAYERALVEQLSRLQKAQDRHVCKLAEALMNENISASLRDMLTREAMETTCDLTATRDAMADLMRQRCKAEAQRGPNQN